ncbi:hypothetical protein WJX74_006383 [Apatococcus lobatus]|uniref:CCR4-NOT transcription complex subunit 10 n=1 Tax=Apatococcus lobatus TaxID=904363 RepID=A0AAW1R2S5_9CHLO
MAPEQNHSEAAHRAAAAWQSRDFASCCKALDQLGKSSTNPLSLGQNTSIAKFLASGGAQPEQLLQELSVPSKASIGKPGSDADHAAGDLPEGTADMAYLAVNKARVQLSLGKRASAAADLEPLQAHLGQLPDDLATRVMLLLADVHLGGGSPAKAAEIISQMEQTQGLQLDRSDDKESGGEQYSEPESAQEREDNMLLTPRQLTGQASDLAQLLSSPSFPGSATAEAAAPPLTATLLNSSRSADAPPSSVQGEKRKVAGMEGDQLVLVYKARLHLMGRNLKAARRLIKAILAADPASPQGHALRAELEFERHNYRRAARILNAAHGPMSPAGAAPAQGFAGQAPGPGQPGHPGGSADASEHMSQAYVLANAGCIAHRQQQHNMAALCFSNAVRQYTSVQEGAEAGMGESQRLQLTYHAGLQALQLRNHAAALSCFQEAGRELHGNPLLWLRMAEACLGGYQDLQQAPANDRNTQYSAGQAVAALIDRADAADTAPTMTEIAFRQRSMATTAVSSSPADAILQHVVRCLQAASILADRPAAAAHRSPDQSSAEDSARCSQQPGTTPSISAPAAPQISQLEAPLANGTSPREAAAAADAVSSSFQASLASPGGSKHTALTGAAAVSVAAILREKQKESSMAKASAQRMLAYVRLLQGNHAAALCAASQALQESHLPKAEQWMVRTYQAQALCGLDRADEAVACLAAALEASPITEPPHELPNPSSSQVAKSSLDEGATLDRNGDDSQKGSAQQARATLLVDLASIQLRQGQFQEVQAICSQVFALLDTNQPRAGSSKIWETAAGLLALIDVCEGKAPGPYGRESQADMILAC